MSRRLPRRAVLALCGAGLLVLALVAAGGGRGEGDATADATVVVLTEPAAAGETLDPGRLAVVRYGGAEPPAGAFTRIEDVAFRTAAVALPARLPLVPSLVRAPGQGGGALRPGERAVGVRVDEAGGLPGLLRAGVRVDVLRTPGGRDGGGVEALAQGVEVLAKPQATADGRWAVALRVPATLAVEIAAAEAAGERITLLPRAEAS